MSDTSASVTGAALGALLVATGSSRAGCGTGWSDSGVRDCRSKWLMATRSDGSTGAFSLSSTEVGRRPNRNRTAARQRRHRRGGSRPAPGGRPAANGVDRAATTSGRRRKRWRPGRPCVGACRWGEGRQTSNEYSWRYDSGVSAPAATCVVAVSRSAASTQGESTGASGRSGSGMLCSSGRWRSAWEAMRATTSAMDDQVTLGGRIGLSNATTRAFGIGPLPSDNPGRTAVSPRAERD